jgi:hypothetical protein
MAGDVVRKLICRHYFHHDCIRLWVIRQKICPNCKINPFSGEYKNEESSQEQIMAERNRLSREAARRAFT